MLRLFALLLFPLAAVASDFRAAWVASVYNINFPSSSSPVRRGREGADIRILTVGQGLPLERPHGPGPPESDALYPSELEPGAASHGTQGQSPGTIRCLLHREPPARIEIHAWSTLSRRLQCRAGAGRNHIANRFPQYAYHVGSVLWMDPGRPPCRTHPKCRPPICSVRYDLAGIHFDDYFYPYRPTAARSIPSDRTTRVIAVGIFQATGAGTEAHPLMRRRPSTSPRREGKIGRLCSELG